MAARTDDNAFGYFWGNSPNINQQLRQRIAMQMMSGRKGYPKNVGEGLTAIGDSLGDIGMARMLEKSAATAAEADKADVERLTGAGPRAEGDSEERVAYAPPRDAADDNIIPPAVIRPPVVAQQPPPPPIVTPSPLQTTAPQTTALPPAMPSNAPAPFDDRFNAAFPNRTPGPSSELMQPPAVAPAMAAGNPRDRATAILANRMKTAQGVPPPNPMLAGSVPQTLAQAPLGMPSPSTPAAIPPGGPPDQRLALASSGNVSDAPPILPSGIRAAPPPVQLAQAANPYAAASREPVMPARVPMTRQEFEMRKAASDPNRPELAQRLKPYIDTLEANRTAEDARRVEQYRADVQLHNQLKLKGIDYEAGAPKRNLELQEAQQKVQAGPHTTVNNRLMVPDPAAMPGEARPWIDVTAPAPGSKGGGPPQTKITKEQSDTIKFLTQIELSEEQLRGKEHILAQGYKDAALNKIPFVGNALLSREYRLAANAANFGVNANLRDESGAAIGISEEAKRLRQLAPALGDDEAQLRDKRERRREIMASMRAGLGDAQPHYDWAKEQMMQIRRNEQARINEEMAGYVPKHGGAPKVGDIAKRTVNGKVQERIFDGTNWKGI